MNSLLISTSSLAPEFSLPTLSQSAINLSALLLGQERALDAFKLNNAIRDQQLYLADFPGIDRHLIIQALMETLAPQSPAYLVATRPIDPIDKTIKFQWQYEQPLEDQGCVAEKSTHY